MREEELEVALKVVIVGNGGVGKSSMIQRYCRGVFTKDYKKTIGVDFLERQIEVDGEDVRLMLWDTAGQEEFDAITKAYYRGAQACVLAFSTTDRDSFEAAHSWKLKVENECGEIPTVIVQNKIDLLDQSVVNPEEVDLLARALGCKLIRTSVKEDLNVAAVFRHLASKCLAELHDTNDFDYITAPNHHHLPNSLTISAFSPSHSSKNHNNGTIVLRPNKHHKKKKNVLKNACKIL
ncbi:ras-related protein Rab-23 [Coccinella septempunctata]|uniref:ras-related protein Rab-23 n=1 Tax=Coccinella septempunctata TaxID=41139 RepID=UPI001D089CC5|nr:ras-related protein Rab-23 [Coccinella septempunctata]XP_044746643.1 ras-related protein Rab-23 [Coccinella septempunctata]